MGTLMTREQLNEQHASIIRRWTRTIADMGDHVPPRLLDELADVAGQHAEAPMKEAAAIALSTELPLPAGHPLTDDTGHPVRADGTVIPETPAATERRAARAATSRKTTTR